MSILTVWTNPAHAVQLCQLSDDPDIWHWRLRHATQRLQWPLTASPGSGQGKLVQPHIHCTG